MAQLIAETKIRPRIIGQDDRSRQRRRAARQQ
jgi:hypothetical protein